MNNQFILLSLGAGLIVSVAIFAAYKAGQVSGWSTFEKERQEFDLEKLKLNTEYVLERLWGESQGNAELPGGLTFKEIVEKALIYDESCRDQILGLHRIHLDLMSNGASSSYFVHILDVYGQNVM